MASVKSINLESTYCYCCDEDVVPELSASVVTDKIQGISFSYVELAAICPKCGADMRLTASNEKKHKTYLEDFFEKFPNCDRGYAICRDLIYGTRNKECSSEPNCCVTCWNAEMEDADE